MSLQFTARGIAVRIAVILTVALPAAAEQTPSATARACQVTGTLVRIPELHEGSGLAASRRTPGRLWTHNDSGQPVLVALDSQGVVAGQVRVSGAQVEDWEAVAVGPCPWGSCIYIGDIGDNDAKRPAITIYRVQEPAAATGTVAVVDHFRVSYPDGAHDAETLLVTPRGEILIVTKGDTGPVGVYRVPANAKAGGTVTLEQIVKPRSSQKPGADERVTDGDVSPSGAWVVLRTKRALVLHRADELLSGNWQESGRVSLQTLGEPQGEGIAFADERTLFLVGEGGGKSTPGTFGRVTCTL